MKRFEMASIKSDALRPVEFEDVSNVEVAIPSVPMENIWTGGEDGLMPVYLGTDIKQREISVKMMTDAKNLDDYYLLKSEIYGAFKGGRFYFITLDREPAKRYRVVLNSAYTPNRIMPTVSEIEIPFITNKHPYAESVIKSDYIDKNGLIYDDIMTYGLGFSYHENEHIFRNTFKNFRIFNPGTVTIDPVEFDLRIEVTGASSTGLVIENKTTGDYFQVKEQMVKSDILVIDKATILINNANGFRKTNREFLRLAPGWNYFEMNADAKTFFNFRFYYD